MDFNYLTVFNIAMIVGIIGIALLGWRMSLEKRKKDQRKTLAVLGTIGLAIAVLPAFMSIPTLTDKIDFGGETLTVGGQQVATGPGLVCAVEDTTVTLSAIDKFTTVSTGGTHRYRINGGPALEVSDTGTLTASPGDKMSILWFNASTTGAYYSAITEEVIPCSGTKTFSTELYNNGTLTIEVFNEEGNLIDGTTVTPSENETLSAGDVVTLSAKVKGSYQNGLPYGGVVVCSYNRTNFDDCIVDFGGVETNVPEIHPSSSDRKQKAYTIGPILSNGIIDGTVVLDVDDTYQATDDLTFAGANITIYASNPYIDEDNGGAFISPAVEDEDDASTYGHISEFAIVVD